MKKYIHYFIDDKEKIPQFSKKCLDSWIELLPEEYELKMWSLDDLERIDDCDIANEIASLDGFNIKKDFIKIYALYTFGGIFVDQNIKLIKKIDDLLIENKSLLGLDERHDISTNIWYESEKKGKLSSKVYNKFKKNFPEGKYNNFFIDLNVIIKECLKDYDPTNINSQKLDNGTLLLSKDYFNPYSYDGQTKYLSANTRVINYIHYDFITPKGRLKNFIYKYLGNTISTCLFSTFRFFKKIIKTIAKPLLDYRKMKKKNTDEHKQLVLSTIEKIEQYNKKDYVAFHNPEFTGVSNATIELFENCIPCGELISRKEIKLVSEKLINSDINEVIFSGFCIGWYELAKILKKNNIIVKTFFHGSHSQYLDEYGWKMNKQIFELERKGIVKEMAFCKESLINFYKDKGCNVKFLKNIVNIDYNIEQNKKNDKIFRVGIYAVQTTNWKKNVFSSLAAVALYKKEISKKIVADIVPKSDIATSFMHIVGIETDGVEKNIPREDLLRRMSKCNINLYVTYTECAPMLPLESFYVGTPCLTGNNHHYFKDSELEKYLVIDNENSPYDISKKIKLCIKNKEKIMKDYKKFSDSNLIDGKKKVSEFIEIKGDSKYE